MEMRTMKAIGMVEYKTVSTGIKAADLIVKTAEVELIQAQTVCPGKFIILFTGDLSAIRVSVDAAKREYPESLIDSFVLGNPHESLFKALTCTADIENIQALGVVETFTGASAIVAADHAAKTAQVDVFEIRVARGMCGKSYVLMSGTVAAVTEAVESSVALIKEEGLMLDYAVIPSPSKEFVKTLI
jgi:microcompartment protein CcmL/EutN